MHILGATTAAQVVSWQMTHWTKACCLCHPKLMLLLVQLNCQLTAAAWIGSSPAPAAASGQGGAQNMSLAASCVTCCEFLMLPLGVCAMRTPQHKPLFTPAQAEMYTQHLTGCMLCRLSCRCAAAASQLQLRAGFAAEPPKIVPNPLQQIVPPIIKGIRATVDGE